VCIKLAKRSQHLPEQRRVASRRNKRSAVGASSRVLWRAAWHKAAKYGSIAALLTPRAHRRRSRLFNAHKSVIGKNGVSRSMAAWRAQ